MERFNKIFTIILQIGRGLLIDLIHLIKIPSLSANAGEDEVLAH